MIILVSSRSSLADYSLDFGTPWGCSCSFCICWRILSGNISHGLRNTSSATTLIDNSESYTNVMQQAGISQRKKIIVERANYLAKGVDRCLVMQSNLLDEVVNLVEAPVPVLGKFSESFLVLPKDLLVMVMQKHQKHFALTDTNRSLLPYFIAVANGAIIESIVRKGNEAVLRARYEDAKFFYELDTSKRFSEFRGQLNGILLNFFPTLRIDKITCICLVSL
ncbi:putative glycine--tRNA ligase [Helianthus annuus]|uniref:glycine--tRNA ligase n=2 Tax=Helianthus annuus TaxID=4232 RepID=A0A9K3IK71_HELAN|nr:putative glycine--tRNA ligase [Helianthus annuus]KAJ0904470.1 putative glycine--tRNA ligase [Helianthus annuus]